MTDKPDPKGSAMLHKARLNLVANSFCGDFRRSASLSCRAQRSRATSVLARPVFFILHHLGWPNVRNRRRGADSPTAIAITGVIGGMADALARRLRMGSIGILIVDDVAKRRSAAPFKHCLFDPYLIGIAGLRTQDFHRR
jgi:hypothetical protein